MESVELNTLVGKTTELIKVDRKKMENMILTVIDTPSSSYGTNKTSKAKWFFDTIMCNTNTVIIWPTTFKISATRNNKPQVKIIGLPVNVDAAKYHILKALDHKKLREVIDVSHKEHPHLIGRGGSNIKQIMNETLTHIHFPDSNLRMYRQPSNAVALFGTLEGMEKACGLIRSSSSLIFSFELPIMSEGLQSFFVLYIADVELKYNIHITFSTSSTLIFVNGSVKEAENVKTATQLLINFVSSTPDETYVQTQMEISDIVNEVNIVSIMELTKTTISYSDAVVKPNQTTQATIRGLIINDVFVARNLLISNLKVTLMFKIPYDLKMHLSCITNISEMYGVGITVAQKSANCSTIIIKGTEKNRNRIYTAYSKICKITKPERASRMRSISSLYRQFQKDILNQAFIE